MEQDTKQNLRASLLKKINNSEFKRNADNDEQLNSVKDDKDFMLYFLPSCAHALQYLSDRLKEDKDIVEAATTSNGYAIKFASKKWQDDVNLAMKVVVNNHTNNLQYLSDRLKDNREVVIAAVTCLGTNFQYASERLRDDDEIVMIAMQQSAYMIKHASERINNNKDYALFACNQKADNIWTVLPIYKEDYDVVLATVNSSGSLLREASDNLRNDKTIVLAACKQNSSAIKFASEEIQAEIGSNDPVQYLQSFLQQEKLNKIIPNKPIQSHSKIKI